VLPDKRGEKGDLKIKSFQDLPFLMILAQPLAAQSRPSEFLITTMQQLIKSEVPLSNRK